ncbi:hypothetical protein NDU88_001057 [Pleurodeles waltl]|uniref:Uncharacterized protein n=1 Tax=Pleurodeles waltl TaxID=8319 RepID=A0AAV7RBV4_PLEWA|nr:hypothetical protein NDU88_001057 [Pleurodeles waltl]
MLSTLKPPYVRRGHPQICLTVFPGASVQSVLVELHGRAQRGSEGDLHVLSALWCEAPHEAVPGRAPGPSEAPVS